MMKTINTLLILFFMVFLVVSSKAQVTTAYDFTMNDCNGKMHHLFSELDSGNVIIIEYFMISCSPCIAAGHDLEDMLVPLRAQYGNKVRFYQFGYTNSYSCSQVTNWVTTNGFTSVPFDSGGVQVAYYGGMGMPTTAVLAGKDHKVLFTNTGFDPGDTTVISKAVHDFFNPSPLGVLEDQSQVISTLASYPNPAADQITLEFTSAQSGMCNFALFDILGCKQKDFSFEKLNAGPCRQTFAIPSLPVGVYFIRGTFQGITFTQSIYIMNHK